MHYHFLFFLNFQYEFFSYVHNKDFQHEETNFLLNIILFSNFGLLLIKLSGLINS